MNAALWLVLALVLFGLNVFTGLLNFRDGAYGWVAVSAVGAISALSLLVTQAAR